MNRALMWAAVLALAAAAFATSACSRNGEAAPDGGEAAPAAAGAAGRAGAPGLDHVVIGINDAAGALAAYGRLGFEVLPVNRSGAAPADSGGLAGFILLGNGFVEFVSPGIDSVGQTQPYTFEGGLALGWEIRDTSELRALDERGVRFSEPLSGTTAQIEQGGERPAWRLYTPDVQPVSGTAIYLVDVDDERRGVFFDSLAGVGGGAAAPDHPNGARRLAYVTIAVNRLQRPLEILEQWGLDPAEPISDPRGAQTVRVPLSDGTLYLASPTSAGGISDFLEDRRAKAPPVGDRLYEGSILAVGLGVDDLDQTIAYLDERRIPHVAMDLPSGRTEVVQGAPQWNLRLEFVEEAEGAAAVEGGGGGETAEPGDAPGEEAAAEGEP